MSKTRQRLFCLPAPEKNILKQHEAKRQGPKTLTKEQIQQLLDACLNQRDRLLVRLLYESAIRVGEALSLTKSWLTLGSHIRLRWGPIICSSNNREHEQAKR